ncbi:MAG TPA: hypothetical protein VNR61_07980, partial [Niallia sp.]|nr:hypothetical protein [Niallia sp.]
MYYLLALLLLSLNPFIWKTHLKKNFLSLQILRLLAGILVIFCLDYFLLIDHSQQAFTLVGLIFIAISLF